MATLNMTRRDNERGQAIIEMALTLPLLLLVVLGIFDFGLMFHRFEVVTNAAREGARVGVLPNYTTDVAKTRALQYLTVSGLGGPGIGTRTTCGGTKVPNSRCAVAVFNTTNIPGTGGAPATPVNQVVVTVEFDHEHVFVGPIMGLFGSVPPATRLRSTSAMRREVN